MVESKIMTLKDFVDQGFLQELNRQFLHKHGLAMSVIEEESGKVTFNAIMQTDDPEGFYFGMGRKSDSEKQDFVDKAWAVKECHDNYRNKRGQLFGYTLEQTVLDCLRRS